MFSFTQHSYVFILSLRRQLQFLEMPGYHCKTVKIHPENSRVNGDCFLFFSFKGKDKVRIEISTNYITEMQKKTSQ